MRDCVWQRGSKRARVQRLKVSVRGRYAEEEFAGVLMVAVMASYRGVLGAPR